MELCAAKKEHKKGRAKGGIITAMSKEIKNIEVREISEATMKCEMVYNENKWRIITVYSQEVEKTMERLMEHIQEEEGEYLIIGEDLKARTGSERGLVLEEENEKRNKSRKSIDKIINKKGRRLIGRIEERGWAILNGSFEEEGGWTYIGERGFSLIDHMIGNDGACEEIKRVEEGNRNGVRSHPIRGRAVGTANNEKR